MKSSRYKKKTSPLIKKKILVTGGAGFLGSILVPQLLRDGYIVRVLDQLYFGDKGLNSVLNHPHLEIIKEDILYQENIPHLMNGVDTVIHLASISNDPSCDLDPNLTIQTNFLATMSLARRAQSAGVKRFIFTSSCSVYGASGTQTLDVGSPTAPVTLYALTKLQSERELLKLSSAKFSVTLLRFATLFGYSPRMRFDLAVNAMTKRALQGQDIIVNGDGKQYRPFLHVADAALSIQTVLEKPAKTVASQIYNVGDESLNYTISDLAELVQKQFPTLAITKIPHNNDPRSYKVRFAGFKKSCGFATRRSILDGILEIKNRHENGYLPEMDSDPYYNVLVMKRSAKQPFMMHSLASSPYWASKDPLIKSA